LQAVVRRASPRPAAGRRDRRPRVGPPAGIHDLKRVQEIGERAIGVRRRIVQALFELRKKVDDCALATKASGARSVDDVLAVLQRMLNTSAESVARGPARSFLARAALFRGHSRRMSHCIGIGLASGFGLAGGRRRPRQPRSRAPGRVADVPGGASSPGRTLRALSGVRKPRPHSLQYGFLGGPQAERTPPLPASPPARPALRWRRTARRCPAPRHPRESGSRSIPTSRSRETTAAA